MSNVGHRQVGEFTSSRKLIRAQRNPADVCTVVSIYPKDLKDKKDTLTPPNRFLIPAGSYDNPTVIVVGTSSWIKDGVDDQPSIEIPVNAVQLVNSIITDYCQGLLGVDMGTNMPGFFFMPGTITKLEVQNKYKLKLAEAKQKQDNWFRLLVRLGDSLWSRGNGNPLVIMDEMRLGARELGIDKPWIKDFQNAEMIKCFACGGLRNPAYPICPTCKVVDQTHALAKDLKFAV